jgi:transcriptional regulator GlxA family with amidase domain
MSPKDYVNRCRIKRAERMLRDTDMPIERIISECGFSNRTAFFQKFSKAIGRTPLQYRKNQK